jgi:hypothetical protein
VALDTRFRRNVRRLLRLASPALRVALRSPAHWPVSGRLLLLSVTGRRTGTTYTFPVRYHRDGDLLKVITANNWWRNLRDGPTPVTVWLRGRRRAATARAHHGDDTVAAELPDFLARNPALAKMYGIPRAPEGGYPAEHVRAAAAHVAVVHIRPQEAP